MIILMMMMGRRVITLIIINFLLRRRTPTIPAVASEREERGIATAVGEGMATNSTSKRNCRKADLRSEMV